MAYKIRVGFGPGDFHDLSGQVHASLVDAVAEVDAHVARFGKNDAFYRTRNGGAVYTRPHPAVLRVQKVRDAELPRRQVSEVRAAPPVLRKRVICTEVDRC